MAFPVSVQRYGVWNAHAYPGQQHDVHLDGCPEVWGFLRAAPWPVLRAGLRRWERAASDAQGCELVVVLAVGQLGPVVLGQGLRSFSLTS